MEFMSEVEPKLPVELLPTQPNNRRRPPAKTASVVLRRAQYRTWGPFARDRPSLRIIVPAEKLPEVSVQRSSASFLASFRGQANRQLHACAPAARFRFLTKCTSPSTLPSTSTRP